MVGSHSLRPPRQRPACLASQPRTPNPVFKCPKCAGFPLSTWNSPTPSTQNSRHGCEPDGGTQCVVSRWVVLSDNDGRWIEDCYSGSRRQSQPRNSHVGYPMNHGAGAALSTYSLWFATHSGEVRHQKWSDGTGSSVAPIGSGQQATTAPQVR